MKFHKFISVLLHPIVIPTIGVLLFLSLNPVSIPKDRQYLLIALVFFATYIVPSIALVILKSLGLIKSFHVESIQERKIPLFLMLLIFFVLGKLLYNVSFYKELGLLFYGTNITLVIIYLLFFFKVKTSLHIMSMASALGFILMFGGIHSLAILPIAIIFILLTGILASSRLHLKAHTSLEIYLGFFLGLLGQFVGFTFL